MRLLTAAAGYFALVFAAGAVLGPVRELWLVPRYGPVAGVLAEAPIMLVAMALAARFVLRRFDAGGAPSARIALGLVAFTMLMIAEVAGSLWLRGLSPSQYLAHFATAPGIISLALFAIFAAMPALVGRRRRA